MCFFRRDDNDDNDDTPGCFATLLQELSPFGHYYFVHDPVTDRILDIPESFAPLSTLALAGKVFMAAATMGTMVYVIIEQEHKGFMFAYFSYCALALQCVYHMLSVSNSIWASSIDQPKFYADGRVRFTWYMFNISMAASIIMAGLWWGFIFDSSDDLSYEVIGPHGVTLLAQYIDGFWINRIPIRFKHWYISVLPLTLFYSLWLYLQGEVLDRIDNPDSTEDDLIYDEIDWKDDFGEALIDSVIIVFGIGPLVQVLLFVLSLYHIPCLCMKDRRFYMDSEKRRTEMDSVAEASMYY